MQTIPIDNDLAFRALEAHVTTVLAGKSYSPLARKGSTSWIDTRIKPADASVWFKLCYFPDGIWFGVREDWATSLGITLTSLGPTSETVRPSNVLFRGDYVQDNPAGRRKINSMIALFP